jgi:hypothetical protein
MLNRADSILALNLLLLLPLPSLHQAGAFEKGHINASYTDGQQSQDRTK